MLRFGIDRAAPFLMNRLWALRPLKVAAVIGLCCDIEAEMRAKKASEE